MDLADSEAEALGRRRRPSPDALIKAIWSRRQERRDSAIRNDAKNTINAKRTKIGKNAFIV
jgi:hypothetical protein